MNLAVPFDPVASKELWLGALDYAEAFARSGPTEEVGCLYYSPKRQSFAVPDRDKDLTSQELVPHFGPPFGVPPRVSDV